MVMSDSDSEEQGSSEPTAKRAKKLAKKNDNVKWEKKHIQPKPTSSLDQDKIMQAQLINKHTDLVQATIWNTFESVFSDMAEFLAKETNRYVTCNKNKPEFSISMKEMLQFIGLIFCQPTTYAFLKEITGAHTRIYDVMLFTQLWVGIPFLI